MYMCVHVHVYTCMDLVWQPSPIPERERLNRQKLAPQHYMYKYIHVHVVCTFGHIVHIISADTSEVKTCADTYYNYDNN